MFSNIPEVLGLVVVLGFLVGLICGALLKRCRTCDDLAELERRIVACQYCRRFTKLPDDGRNESLYPFICKWCGLLSMESPSYTPKCGRCCELDHCPASSVK